MKIIIRLIVSVLAIAIAAYLIPGITIAGVVPAIVLAVVIGVINTFIRPILMVLTLPLSVVTLGLFALVLNTLLIMLAAAVVPGVSVSGFLSALLFGIVLVIVTALLKKVDGDPNS